jgi:hypothetical protein
VAYTREYGLPGFVEHGASAYRNWGCKCGVCLAANTDEQRRVRVARYAVTAEQGLPASVKHGRSAYQNWGCRCEVCTADHNAMRKKYR